MKLEIDGAGKTLQFDSTTGIDISIPLQFNGPQPACYGAAPAASAAYKSDGFVGDTRQAGSCNCETYTLTPHCNGTHTECVGHIALERISIHSTLRNCLLPAYLISLTPAAGVLSNESYDPPLEKCDQLITRKSLEQGLAAVDRFWLEALIVRTLPNDAEKMQRLYGEKSAPFFSLEAMNYLCGLGIKHLLIDTPSVDRASDQGRLSCHRIFWEIPPGSMQTAATPGRLKTITELIYVPDTVNDGEYVLNLQIAPFMADASPSRPVLYALNTR